jgi:hypothetical protein
MRYEHSQFGKVIAVSLGAAVVAFLVILERAPEAEIGLWIALVFIVGALVMFYSLTVTVTDEHLCWKFGVGPIRKRVRLADIAEVEIVRTRWFDGWGIHWTRRGWLYNVSGFQAVAVSLKSGKRFMLGTDEPERLVEALRERLSAEGVDGTPTAS